MFVQILTPCIVAGENRASGDVLDLPLELANPLIASGRGVRAEPPAAASVPEAMPQE